MIPNCLNALINGLISSANITVSPRFSAVFPVPVGSNEKRALTARGLLVGIPAIVGNIVLARVTAHRFGVDTKIWLLRISANNAHSEVDSELVFLQDIVPSLLSTTEYDKLYKNDTSHNAVERS